MNSYSFASLPATDSNLLNFDRLHVADVLLAVTKSRLPFIATLSTDKVNGPRHVTVRDAEYRPGEPLVLWFGTYAGSFLHTEFCARRRGCPTLMAHGSAWFGTPVLAGLLFRTDGDTHNEDFGYPERFDDSALEEKADKLFSGRVGTYRTTRENYRAIPLVVSELGLRLLHSDRHGSNFVWRAGEGNDYLTPSLKI